MKIAINNIVIPESRKRSLNKENISSLAESMKEIGLLQPIAITENNELISGLHRLEAAKILGWNEIDCVTMSLNDIDRELAEIDENLIRTELTVLERAEHLKKRKELYEAKMLQKIKAKQAEKDAWITKARKEFNPGPHLPCLICNKYEGITEAHHIIPLALQYDLNVKEPIQDYIWLCPNHHAIAHKIIVWYVNRYATNLNKIPYEDICLVSEVVERKFLQLLNMLLHSYVT